MRPDSESVRLALCKDLLSGDFNRVLLDIYAERGEAELVEYPVTVFGTIRAAPAVFPFGELYLSRAKQNDSEGLHVDVTYEVTLFWHTIATDEDEVERKLDRLLVATREYYSKKTNLFPYLEGTSVWLGDEDYAPFVPIRIGEQAQPLMKSGAVGIFVRVHW